MVRTISSTLDCKDLCCERDAAAPWDPDPALNLRFRDDDSFKSQIVREMPLTDAAKNMNKIFQSMLKDTVWENYMLISTQWPSVFRLHQTAFEARVRRSRKTDFYQATRHDLFAGADIPGELHAGDLQPGEDPARLVELYRLSRQRSGLPKRRVESAGRQSAPNQSDFTFMLEKAQ